MQINNNNYSIMEIISMLGRHELVVNLEYQRGSGIWPRGASSYFIDTILEEYPFPKIYMYEFINKDERSVKREIVDGQQRINAIRRFADNKLVLGKESSYPGKKFQDLDDETHEKFFAYSVSVDVIRNAKRSEILQMFRRMNAYTLPLNEAEKRHSSFQGEFKWFVNNIADHLNEFFVEFGVFTSREIVRMSDAALIADCIVAIENGIVSASPTGLRTLYKNNDEEFQNAERYGTMLKDTFDYIAENFGELRKTFMMKPYALHSLITALIHCRFGIPSLSEEWRIKKIDCFAIDPEIAGQRLLELAQAHEAKEEEGVHSRYVWGCLSSTNKKARRAARIAALLRILGAEVSGTVDDNLA